MLLIIDYILVNPQVMADAVLVQGFLWSDGHLPT